MGSKKLGILFLVSVLLAFLAGYYSSQILPTLPVGSGSDIFEDLTDDFNRYYYYDIDDAEVQDAFVASMEAIVNSYAESNNDPYTRLIASPLSVTPSGDESFIGMGVAFIMEDLDLRVTYVYPNGAAEDLLFPNDLVVGIVIENESLYFNTLASETEVLSYLSGDLDDVKSLIVLNPDNIELQIDITYKEILTPTAYTEDLQEPDISYIKITEFSGYIQNITAGTSKVFSDLLNELEESTLDISSDSKTLIIDLRDNPGGTLTALHNSGDTTMVPGITQQLLTKNVETPLFQMIPKTDKAVNYYGNLTTPKAYDIAVLVNGHSASAAEVLAAALNTYGGYPLYGNPTYGKGVYQNTKSIRDVNDIRYSLVYTEGEWFYDDGKNVATDPLDVNIIEQEGIHTVDLPVYNGLVSLNEVSLALSSYQSFLNYYYDLTGINMLRIDGYFDLATQNAFEDYQLEQGLTVTGTLNRETAISIHQIYMEQTQDLTYDMQLQNLIDLIKS